jgi:hypothetical protein
MKQSLAMFCILCISMTVCAQDKNFDLSKYKFPDYKRHELELNFNSSGSSNRYYSVIPSTTNYNGTTYNNSHSNFDSRINIGYQFVNFTRKRIDQITSGLNGYYQNHKSENSDEYAKESIPSMGSFFQASRRNYLTENKVFIEGLTYVSFNSSKRKSTYDSGVNTDISTSNNFTISAGIGVGIGRIERVNDLWQGYYILEKLKQQNSLSRELKEQDIFEFAELISKLQNKRFFDARLREIAELQSLDSILHAKKLIEHSDISYFATLNDYWSFPINFDRKSGRELKLQLAPGYGSEYNKSNDAKVFAPATTNLVSKVLFDCSKQLNLFWERNIHVDMINTTLLAKNGDASENHPGNLIGTNASFGYGFFPDSRTRLGFSGKYSGNESPYYLGENMTKVWMNSFIVNLEANYFISPQLQITGNFNGSYWFSEHNSTEGHSTNFNLGFRYAIF